MKLLACLLICFAITTTLYGQCLPGYNNLPYPYINLKLGYQKYNKSDSIFLFEMPVTSMSHLRSVGKIIIPDTSWKIEQFTMVFYQLCNDTTGDVYEGCSPHDQYSPFMYSRLQRSCAGTRICFNAVIVRNRNGERYQLYPVNLTVE